ncbi:hypothetical protein LSAT2_017611, partial [Lamellibrachia satsuma]
MKDVGQAVVAIFLWCFFTQIGHSCGERRQNAIHEFHTYDKTVPVVYSGRHQQSSTLTEVSPQCCGHIDGIPLYDG